MPSTQTAILPCQATRAHLSAGHFAWLHPKGSVGRAWIGRKVVDADGERFEGETVDLSELWASTALTDAAYVSLNRFWGRRRSGECLKAVGNIVLDFDYQNDDRLPYVGWVAEAVQEILAAAIEAAGVPQPSIWVATGRGLQATWGCDGAKASAWARVRAVYDALHGPDLATNGMPKVKRRHADAVLDAFEARMLPLWRVFRDAGLDRVCRDGARVVRLVGSVNAKTGTMARLLSPATFADATRYTFHALADAVLPLTRHRLQEIRQARAEAKAVPAANDNPTPAKPRRHAGPAGRWVGILRDLHAWRDGMGGPPKGKREMWAFLTANATAHVREGCREDWAAELAHLAGLSEREVFRALGTLDRRQRRHEAGETDEYEGVEQSVLYNHSAAYMVDLLDIQVEQADAFGLRSLYPGGGKALTPSERQHARRRRLGIETAADAADRRLWIGMWALGQRTDGWSLADICAHHDLGKDAILAAMRLAADEFGLDGAIDIETLLAARDASVADVASRWGQTGSDVPADATEEASEIEPVGFASRLIVGSASREGRPASEPVSSATGEVRVTRHTRTYATIETGTATWDWLRVEDDRGRLCHFEWTLLTPAAAVSAGDAALAETARRELASGSDKPVRRSSHPERRRGYRSRPEPVRTAPLPPLDLAREAQLYLDACGGRSAYRARRPLVAA